MEFIFLIVGIVIGVAVTMIFNNSTKAYGFIEIDHEKQLCNVVVSSEELSNRKKKKAMLKIIHDVEISQDIQGL